MANEVYCRIDPEGTAHIEEMVPVSIQELQQLRKDAKLGAKVRGMEQWHKAGVSYDSTSKRLWVFAYQAFNEGPWKEKAGDTPEEALGCET